MSKSILEKYPKLSTLILSSIIFVFTVSIIIVVLRIDILQDYEDGEKYSIADKIKYAIRCHNRRSVRLREIAPNRTKIQYPAQKFETLEHKKYILRTNKDGFIEPAFIHQNPDLKIFFVGGSTTECETVD